MSKWTERFESHPIHEKVRATDDQLTQARDRASDDPEALQTVERLAQVMALFRSGLNATDPVLVSALTLDQLEARVGTIQAGLRNYLLEEGACAILARN